MTETADDSIPDGAGQGADAPTTVDPPPPPPPAATQQQPPPPPAADPRIPPPHPLGVVDKFPGLQAFLEDFSDEVQRMGGLIFEKLRADVLEAAGNVPDLIPDAEQLAWLREAAEKTAAAIVVAREATTEDHRKLAVRLKADAFSLVCDVGACKARDGEQMLRLAANKAFQDVLDVAFGVMLRVLPAVAIA